MPLLARIPFDGVAGEFSVEYPQALQNTSLSRALFEEQMHTINKLVRSKFPSKAPWVIPVLLLIVLWGFVFPFTSPRSTWAIVCSCLTVACFIIVAFQQRAVHLNYLNLLEAELQKLSAECESSTGVWMDLRGDPNATSAQAKFGSPSKLTIAYFSGEDDDDDIHLEDYNAMMEYDPTIESQEEIHNVNPMYSPYGNPHGPLPAYNFVSSPGQHQDAYHRNPLSAEAPPLLEQEQEMRELQPRGSFVDISRDIEVGGKESLPPLPPPPPSQPQHPSSTLPALQSLRTLASSVSRPTPGSDIHQPQQRPPQLPPLNPATSNRTQMPTLPPLRK